MNERKKGGIMKNDLNKNYHITLCHQDMKFYEYK